MSLIELAAFAASWDFPSNVTFTSSPTRQAPPTPSKLASIGALSPKPFGRLDGEAPELSLRLQQIPQFPARPMRPYRTAVQYNHRVDHEQGAPMLVLTRRIGEMVLVGDDIQLKIIDVRGDRIRIGIT